MSNGNDPARYNLTLPSGTIASILRNPKARHMRNGQRAAGKDSSMLNYCILAEVALLDGQPITGEAALDMPMADSIVLLGEVFGEKDTTTGKDESAESSAQPTTSH